ncbi:MAG TPA: hypothetical protein VFH38_04145 [Jatrophihabitans sp.]|nr:hypothetical protein [Jatrophihabitans sp.]
MMDRTLTATRMGLLDQIRRPLLVVMLAVIPIIFITWGAKATPLTPHRLTLPDGTRVLSDTRAIMTVMDVPVAIAFLGGLVGVFVVTAALQSDRRLVVAGYTPTEVIVPRLVVLTLAVLVISVVSLVVMAFTFTPNLWGPFIVGNVLAGLTYAELGALAGALIGRLGAVYLMFFLPNIDIGIAQDPLFFNGDPQAWARGLPGYGPTRMIVESSFAKDFTAVGALLPALAWFVGLTVILVLVLRHEVK